MNRDEISGAADVPFPFTETAVRSLLSWYEKSHRILPWRDTGNPEDVWISEIMLQQTRVEAVKTYFTRFRAALPDARAIASCPEDVLLRLWEGLGYYSRARNIKKCAGILVRDYGGSLPEDPALLRKLPGIGPYTAGAIASIAYGVPVPAVDGNVLRVSARLTGSREDISSPAVVRKCTAWIQDLLRFCVSAIPGFSAGNLNQALMELGALLCVPNGAPSCSACPLRSICRADAMHDTASIPYRAPKKKRRIEERTILVIRDGGRFFLRRRPAKGLLAGLYEFPGFSGHLTAQQAAAAAKSLGFTPLRVTPLPEGTHIFTHIEWHMTAFEIRTAELSGNLPEGSVLAEREELDRFALPSAFRTWTSWYALRKA